MSGATTVWLAAALVAAVPAGATAADEGAGKRVFNQCRACHKLEPGGKAIGPSLHGLFGRKAGAVADFAYSKDMAAAGANGLVWTEAAFLDYIADPKGYLGRVLGTAQVSTKMVFAGLKTDKDRRDLLAFLKEATK
jgi:cytochrome c